MAAYRTIAIIALLLLLPVQPAAQDGRSSAADRYRDLVDRAKRADVSVDFVELISAYWEMDSRSTAADRPAMVAAFNAKDYRRAIDLAQKVIDLEFTNRGLHNAMANAYKELQEPVKEQLHRNWANKLFGALLATGDGKSLESAYCVPGIRDEYEIMEHFGYKPEMQALIGSSGGSYDLLSGTDSKTGKPVSLYFDISGNLKRCLENNRRGATPKLPR